MTNPILSISSVALEDGDDPTKLVEGGGTLEIKVTSSSPFLSSQQVMIELTGTANHYGNSQQTLTAVGEGLFSKIEMPQSAMFKGWAQTGTESAPSLFAVSERTLSPVNGGSSQRELIIQKITAAGDLDTSFGTSGSKTILVDSTLMGNQKLVFAADGSFAYQRGSSIALFDSQGNPSGAITLPDAYVRLLCMDGSHVFVQDSNMHGADDIQIYDLQSKVLVDSFSTDVDGAAFASSKVIFGSAEFISPSTRDQFGLTDDGKFVWKDTSGNVYAAQETAGGWTPNVSPLTGYSGETFINNGKFYAFDKATGTLRIADADSGSNQIYNVNLSGKANSNSVNLVGVADDGSILLSANSITVPGLPTGLSAAFKLKLVDPAGAYELDAGFGQGGMILSAQSIGAWDIKASVGDTFLLTNGSSSDSDLSIWSNGPAGGANTTQYNGKLVVSLNMPMGETEASFFVRANGDFLSEAQESLEFKLLPSGSNVIPPMNSNQPYSVDATSDTVRLPLVETSHSQGVDLNGSLESGMDHHNSGPYSYWYNGSTPTKAQPNFYNATVVAPDGSDVSQIKISVKGTGTWSGATDNLAEKFDLVFGYSPSPNQLSPGALNYSSDFKVVLSDTPSLAKAFFIKNFDGINQLFSISQQYDSATETYSFVIGSENGYGMSSKVATEMLSRFGFAYRSDPPPNELHHVNLEIQVEAFDDSNALIPVSSPDGDKSIFEFSNQPPEIYDAAFHGQFIQLMFRSGPSADINYELADLTNSYDSWRGQPDISQFTLTVNGRTDEYQIQNVIQKESILLVLDKALPENAQVSISYADPTGDDIFNVIQSWEGNDAKSFEDYAAQYGHILEFKGQVLGGAELGWNMALEEEAYLDSNFDVANVIGKVISYSEGQAVVEFHPTGWRPNPNFKSDVATGLQADPSAELVFQFSLSKSNWTPAVGASLPLAEALGYDQGYTVHSFKTILNTSSEPWSVGMLPQQSSIDVHDLMVYTITDGVPFSYLASSGFNFTNANFSGSAYDDFLGDPTNLGDVQIDAGEGNDYLVGGIGNDRLNGGKGTDTVYVAGMKDDFLITQTGSNTFTLTPKNPNAWSSGGTDQLISIEKVQFDDAVELLDSVDPQFNTTVTQFDVNSQTIIQPSGNGFDYLDLTSLSVDASGTKLNKTFTVEADFNLDSGAIWVNGSVNTYEFSDFEGYIVSGSAKSNIENGKPYDPIKVSTHASENDIVLVKSGSGLQIDLGDEAASTQDVLSFRGTDKSVTIDLEPASDSNGWVTFTTSDGVSEVAGADFVFGSNADDTITGFDSKSNLLAGYDGNDNLKGGKDSDLLFGGSGSDTLVGDDGDDTLIDLDQAKLSGGAGKDQFVVRGASSEDVAHIDDLELSPEGLARGGVNAQNFADRIIFNFSTVAFANSQLANVVTGASGSLAASDYLRLRNAIELKVEPVSTSPTTQFVVSAYLKESMSPTDSTAGLLGRVEFTTEQTLSNSESIRAVKLAQSADFMNQFEQPVMDQMFNVNSPLDTPATLTDGPVQMFSDTVSLVFGLEKTDKFTVSPQPGEHPPVLIPVQINGIEYATRFQLGNADEKVVGSHAGDTYQVVPSSLIDENGEIEVSQTFGNDVIVERGRVTDSVKIAVSQPPVDSAATPESIPFDNTGRDVISLANETTNTGVSIHDLLVGDLDLNRMQKGREGFENSLKVSYSDSTPGNGSLNDVNLTVYKQYVAQDASFRVEDLQLLDLEDKATRYDLGQSFKSATSQGLTTYDARDAILLARTNAADTFKLVNTATGEPDHDFDVFLKDFNFANDKIQIEGYGKISPNLVKTVENGDSRLSLTLDNGTKGIEDDYTLNLYFLDTAFPTPDDQLIWLKTV